MKTKVREETSLEAAIFYNQPTGVISFNADFKVDLINPAFEQKTGVSATAIIKKSLFVIAGFELSQVSIKNQLKAGGNITTLLVINSKKFEVVISPIWVGNKAAGGIISLGEEVLDNAQLNFLSKKGFKSVIENAPMTIMIFRQNGSVFYTNQHYRNLWGLSDKELYLIHEYYNLFDDQQLNNQAIGPYIKQAFNGKSVELPVINYVLDYSGLGRGANTRKENWLLGYFFPLENPDTNEDLVALIFTEVTRQVEAEQAFKLSQERLELALEGGELGIWDWDLVNNTMVYNKQWAKILGYELDEIDMFTWTGLVHPDDLDWVQKRLDDHIAGKTDAYMAEYRVKSKGGEWKWILDRGKVVEYLPSGKASRVSGTHLDITAKRISEDILKESEQRYRGLVDNLPTGMAIVQDDQVVYANQELYRIMKTPDGVSLEGKQASKCFKDPEAYKSRVKQLLKTAKTHPLQEAEIIDLDGNTRCVEITSIPFVHNDKPAVQSIVIDIQHRKEIEAQTFKAEKLLSQLFENAPMGIVMLGFDDEVLKINKGFEQMFGYQPDEVVGKYINDLIIPEGYAEEAVGLSREANAGKMMYLETLRVDKNNNEVPVMIYTLPVIHEEQRLGVYSIYVDLSKRMKVEEELKVRNLELDNFVYKVSHDLRSPLASILGLINLVKLEGGFTDSFEYLKLMESQVHKLDHFIHDVLSHSKNLKMSLIATKINFNEVIDKCIADLSYLPGFDLVEKNITIEGDYFVSDIWRINEVFRNLIANSIKYKDTTKAQCQLNINIVNNKEKCKITISDNGIGITEESLPHIFEMFYRATDTSKGSGIGLYIVKNAIEKLGGTIQLESLHGKGTTFSIELPALQLKQ